MENQHFLVLISWVGSAGSNQLGSDQLGSDQLGRISWVGSAGSGQLGRISWVGSAGSDQLGSGQLSDQLGRAHRRTPRAHHGFSWILMDSNGF